MMADEILICTAEPGDAAALADFAERSFRDAFGSDNTPADVVRYVALAYGEQIQHAEISDPQRVILLAKDRDSIIGYAQLLSGTTPCCVRATPAIELERFYVASEWHGRGLAQRLMQRATDAASCANAAALWLGVWERNARGIAFYRKAGFVDVGSKPFQLGTDMQTDRVMCRALDGATL